MRIVKITLIDNENSSLPLVLSFLIMICNLINYRPIPPIDKSSTVHFWRIIEAFNHRSQRLIDHSISAFHPGHVIDVLESHVETYILETLQNPIAVLQILINGHEFFKFGPQN